MGRGRAKAKQTKVARELKYSAPQTDLTALQRELAGSGDSSTATARATDDDLDDGYPGDEDGYDSWATGSR